MANLSQEKRLKMLEFLSFLKDEHKDNDEALKAIHEIENEIVSKKYGLVWEEHEENVDIQMRTHVPVFSEVKDKEVIGDEDNPNFNFLLEGDNLHSLKLLEKTHKGKIDVIYIDPPYNTGNSFIYDDCMVGDEDTFKHSKWLSFMQKRLIYAKKLLKNTGSIFISINDYEAAPLRMLCDEIFGENNFIGQLTWESTTQPINAGKARFSLQKKVESIYCFAKNKSEKPDFLLREREGKLKYPHMGKLGKCRFEIIEKSDAGAYKRDTMKFKILGQFPREGKRWQIGIDTARRLEKENKVEIVDGIVKKAVYPEDELHKRKFDPFWSHLTASAVGTAQSGKEELNKIFNRALGFDTVKPVKLIKELISHFHNEVTVLDFFAGSGTTGQAVLELNSEDDGNRKFILCTNNDSNICSDITYPRIKTIITGKRLDDSGYSKGIPANLKYYKTDFIPKVQDDEDDVLSDNLLSHIKEMVQLEHGIDIDNQKYHIILTDDDADRMEKEWDKYKECKALYISKNVLLTTSQNVLFSSVEINTIPDYYFESELREVGEIW